MLNLLTGENRAIVTDIAGTTRDVLEEYINLHGITLKMADTAGIRQTEDVVEKIGVGKAKELAKDADGAVQSAGKTARADERVLPKTRTVKRGDTLWGIACELYGDGTRWREIAKKNGVTEPRKLPVGKVLVL